MKRVRKRLARAFARSFAAGIIENTETGWQEDTGLTEEELEEANKEMLRIAERIKKDYKLDGG